MIGGLAPAKDPCGSLCPVVSVPRRGPDRPDGREGDKNRTVIGLTSFRVANLSLRQTVSQRV
jgi:hypothetical protein